MVVSGSDSFFHNYMNMLSCKKVVFSTILFTDFFVLIDEGGKGEEETVEI